MLLAACNWQQPAQYITVDQTCEPISGANSMLSFATEFPVSHARTLDDFLTVARSWVLGSPHTQFEESDLNTAFRNGDCVAQNDKESVHTLAYQSRTEAGGAVRWKLAKGDLEWLTTVVFSRQEGNAWVGVRTSRESSHPAIRLPPAKKPIIVRSLLRELGGAFDGELQLLQEPHLLKGEDISLASRLLTGKAGCRLPVIYISCGFSGEYLVDAPYLADKLSGMAHVVVEPNRAFSRGVQTEADSENVYGGTIGAYWPNGAGRRSFFIGREYDSSEDIQAAVLDEIRVALLNRRPQPRCTWATVQETISKEAVKALKSSGSLQVEKYIELFDVEMAAKAEQLADAEKEISRLEEEIREHESRLTTGPNVTLRAENERDLFPGEIAQIVRDALSDAVDRVQPDSRRRHVLSAILGRMNQSGLARAKREELKSLLRGYKSMDAKTRKGLEIIGFAIEDEGKHYKLVFQGDDRYTFSLPKSGSDHRGGLNAASDISKRMF